VEQLRDSLSRAHNASQVVYVEVEHWTAFPHVRWEHLQPEEQAALQRHFRTCTKIGPYVIGAAQLPPPLHP